MPGCGELAMTQLKASGNGARYALRCVLNLEVDSWCSISAMKLRNLVVAAVVSVLVPAAALPQALTSLSTLRVSYSTRKNQLKPQGDLKAQIDELDAKIAEASWL